MKAVIFARVSSKDQEDGHSLDAQIQSCFKYAIDKNFTVVKQFRVVESSTAIGRPEFSKMVNYVKAQKDKIIVLCYCVDRLQRDFDEQYIELQRLIKQDCIEIHYIKNEFIEHRDMDSSEKFRKNLDVLLANDYRNKISDNVKRSARKKLEEGTILGDSPGRARTADLMINSYNITTFNNFYQILKSSTAPLFKGFSPVFMV